MLKANIGTSDRLLRLVLGIGLVAFGFYARRWLPVAGIIGGILIGTSTIKWCPAYVPFGLTTCRTEN